MRAAQSLAKYVTLQARETSTESFSKFMDDVNARVMELVHSSGTVTHEKLGGIAAIEVLMDIDYAESAKQITRMANSLHPVMWSRDASVSQHAVAVLGKLARTRGALLADLLESELKRALEWLEDHGGASGGTSRTATSSSSGLAAAVANAAAGGSSGGGSSSASAAGHQNLAALLVLAELGRNAPSIFYPHVSLFLQLIWKGGLLDKDISIRTAACEALTACLVLLQKREHQHSAQQQQDAAQRDAAAAAVSDAQMSKADAMLLLGASSSSLTPSATSSGRNSSAGDAPLQPLFAVSEQQHSGFYNQVYESAMKTLTGSKSASVEVLHGSLIGLAALLDFAPSAFVLARIKQCCDAVLKFWNNSNKMVKRTVIAMIPVLAKAAPIDFAKFYLPTVMQLLLASLKKENAVDQKSALLISVGRTSLACGGTAMKGYLDSLLPLVKSALQAANQASLTSGPTASNAASPANSGPTSGTEALSTGITNGILSSAVLSAATASPSNSTLADAGMLCVAHLAQSIGLTFQSHVRGELMELVFGGGLSVTLVETAALLADAIPPLLIDIQIRLMDLISHLLAHKPFKFPGAPGWLTRTGAAASGGVSGAAPTAAGSGATNAQSATAASGATDRVSGGSASLLMDSGSDLLHLHVPSPSTPMEQTLIVRLALRTLGGFNFHKAMLTEFLRKCVLLYLDDDNPHVRLEAVLTASKLLIPHVHMAFQQHQAATLFGGQRARTVSGDSQGSANTDFGTPPSALATSPMSPRSNSSLGGSPASDTASALHMSLHLSGSTTSLTVPSVTSLSQEAAEMDTSSVSSVPTHAFRYAGFVVSQVLHRLLQVAVTDGESAIRANVIQSLDSAFDPFLAQAENLRLLFMAIHDEVFEIRTGAIQVIGRIGGRNPAYVLPALRKRLIQLLTELDFGEDVDSIAREQSARQLVLLITAAGGRVVAPYSKAVLDTLLRRVSDPDPRVAAHVIDALGQLALVADLTPSFDQLMPIIMDTLQDNASLLKRRAALRTLGHLIRSTGVVIKPLLKYPKLLDSLLSIIKTEQPDLKFLVVKLMGIVGALDPEIQRQNQLRNQKKRKAPTPLMPVATAPLATEPASPQNASISAPPGELASAVQPDAAAEAASDLAAPVTQAGAGDELPAAPANANSPFATTDADDGAGSVGSAALASGLLNISSEDYYPTVAVRALLRILKDQSLSAHHQNAVQAIMSMFKSLGLRCVSFLPQIMPPYLQLLKSSEPRFREFLFQQLAVLVSIVKVHLRDYLSDIFDLVKEFWMTQPTANLMMQLAALIEEVCVALNDEYRAYMPRIVPLLLHVLHVESHASDRRRTYRLLKTIELLGSLLDDYVHLFIPPLVSLIEFERSDRSVSPSPSLSVSTGGATTGSTPGANAAGQPNTDRTDNFQGDTILLSFAAMRCVSSLAVHNGLADWAARLVHPLMRLIDHCCTSNFAMSTSPSLSASSSTLGPSNTGSGASGGAAVALTSASTDLSDFATGTSAVTATDLLQQIMSTLSLLVCQLRHDYIVFIPTIRKVLSRHHIVYPPYENLEASLLTNNMEHFGEESAALWSREDQQPSASRAPDQSPVSKLKVNEQNLRRAWETSSRATKEDWTEWLRKFAIELLRESPSPALRSCLYVVDYAPLVRSLFNAGFVSCWRELSESYQRELVRHLETALLSPNIPQEILQNLLDLAEFMEHDEAPLPIEAQTLAVLADKCHAYAKALHYREIEFKKSIASGAAPSTSTTEALISINNKLGQPHAAAGILRYAQQAHGLELKESWYEKLGRWEEALQAYTAVLSNRAQTPEASVSESLMGRLRSLHALGEWETLLQDCVKETQTRSPVDPILKTLAPLAATAAWYLQEWDTLSAFANRLNENEPDGVFFRAVIHLYHDNFPAATKYINNCRDLLDTELTALFGESYQRAYTALIRAQQLAEMEEIIEYKQKTTDVERRESLKTIWMERLDGVQRDTDVWRRLLAVRAMVIPPAQDLDVWLQFASLSRKCDKLRLSHRILFQLSQEQSGLMSAPTRNQLGVARVRFALIKQLWAEGSRDQALQQVRAFATQVLASGYATDASYQRLLARVSLTTGEWLRNLSAASVADSAALGDSGDDPALQTHRSSILAEFKAATKYDPLWYKAWHAWAMANFELLSSYRANNSKSTTQSSSSQNHGLSSQVVRAHLVPTVQGFFRSIALSPGQNLQDVLRLLTLWFDFGSDKSVEAALADGFGTLSIDVWLPVIPQIIARIHSPVAAVRTMLQHLLVRIGKEHPQALVYPLTVASKSQSSQRLAAARSVMDKMRQHSSPLVDQALLVSRELIRVAILWPEMWYEGLEDASRLYFGERNVDGMLATLAPLHKSLEAGAETPSEASFQSAFGRELGEAHEWCKKYMLSRNDADINRAWDLYYHVFRRINKQLPAMTTLELKNVSPLLLSSRQMDLAVPGTYRAGKPLVRIHNFSPILKVITSKQRPRKLNVVGGDGLDYNFLLKGHEDLRQDERVMQLFELVNSLLRKQRRSSSSSSTGQQSLLDTSGLASAGDLSIQPYSVIPLSPNSGLIGWVAHCDTLHQLIREYRQSRNIPLNIEHRYMLRMASDFDNLSLIQKVEVFEYALESTNGMDVERVLWLKSPNSETWLERRTNYTVSLAVMSMVGYVLGLGDRHPSNLMLDRHTGKVIHIDFGDCFEVAMYREKYPEKIPFRLTRMLVNAMEVSGIEGNFRTTCEQVMGVLRANKDSLMAVLEAFVHDPLINWRLLNQPATAAAPAPTTTEPDAVPSADAEGAAPEAPLPHGAPRQDMSARVLAVINRVSNKLTGRDFDRTIRQGPSGSTFVLPPTPGVAVATSRPLTVTEQVHRLILQSTSVENLCQCYIGWCSFW
jgi:phosphatidylinositol kinase/protein kinase (PI-3  family)